MQKVVPPFINIKPQAVHSSVHLPLPIHTNEGCTFWGHS